MIIRLADLFPIILVSSVSAMVLAPLAKRAAVWAGLVDVPGSAPHKVHRVPTPLAGGAILVVAILVSYPLLGAPKDREVVAILAGTAVMAAWGMVDDRFGLAPYLKIGGQAAVAAFLIWSGIQVHITRIGWLDLAISLVWIVGIVNAFNLVDSMDGLALGLASVSSAFFMMVTIDAGQPVLSALSAGLFGACLGLYFFNATPAFLFLGDSGAQSLGLILAALGIAYVPARAGLPQGVTWFTPILVLGVPIFDTTLVVVSRLRRGKPIYQANRDHTYHRLVALGFDPARSVLAMQLASVMLGLVAFIALSADVVWANVMFFGLCLLAAAAIVFLDARTQGSPNGYNSPSENR